MNQSIKFEWNLDEFNYLVESCKYDDEVKIILKYISKEMLVLEAGCGAGRVAKYLQDMDYDIEGVEINEDIVKQLNSKYPELKIYSGDISKIPKSDYHYNGIISLGVIEHFIDGPEKPLKELFRVLKHGGIAIVTVPSFNKIRQLKKFFNKYFIFLNPKKNNLIRKLFKKDILIPNYLKYKYHVCPIYGPFFEYRFRPLEFEEICRKAGAFK